MNKKILIICEGTKKEPEIFQYVQKQGLLPENVSIVSYGTNIYKLYEQLEAESQNYEDGWESLDIQLVMSGMTNVEKEKELLSDTYTDILLIFDLDPQDPKFRKHMKNAQIMFQKLMNFFCESTEHGKLYFSYPMIEALQHISEEKLCRNDFQAFYQQRYTINKLRKGQYKQLVRNEGEEHIATYSKENLQKLVLLHLSKVEFLTKRGPKESAILDYDENMLNDLLEKELQSLQKDGFGDVVSTSLFYLCEAYPQQFSMDCFL